MNRYIAVVAKLPGGSIESFDFKATGLQGAGSRAQITALARYGNPEAFTIVGLIQVPMEASDELVGREVTALVERVNAES